MPGFDKRETDFTQARNELMHELLSAGAFDMDEHTRGEHVARIVESLEEKYPDLGDRLTRQLRSAGMTARYGDAVTNEAAQNERGVE